MRKIDLYLMKDCPHCGSGNTGSFLKKVTLKGEKKKKEKEKKEP